MCTPIYVIDGTVRGHKTIISVKIHNYEPVCCGSIIAGAWFMWVCLLEGSDLRFVATL